MDTRQIFIGKKTIISVTGKKETFDFGTISVRSGQKSEEITAQGHAITRRFKTKFERLVEDLAQAQTPEQASQAYYQLAALAPKEVLEVKKQMGFNASVFLKNVLGTPSARAALEKNNEVAEVGVSMNMKVMLDPTVPRGKVIVGQRGGQLTITANTQEALDMVMDSDGDNAMATLVTFRDRTTGATRRSAFIPLKKFPNTVLPQGVEVVTNDANLAKQYGIKQESLGIGTNASKVIRTSLTASDIIGGFGALKGTVEKLNVQDVLNTGGYPESTNPKWVKMLVKYMEFGQNRVGTVINSFEVRDFLVGVDALEQALKNNPDLTDDEMFRILTKSEGKSIVGAGGKTPYRAEVIEKYLLKGLDADAINENPILAYAIKLSPNIHDVIMGKSSDESMQALLGQIKGKGIDPFTQLELFKEFRSRVGALPDLADLSNYEAIKSDAQPLFREDLFNTSGAGQRFLPKADPKSKQTRTFNTIYENMRIMLRQLTDTEITNAGEKFNLLTFTPYSGIESQVGTNPFVVSFRDAAGSHLPITGRGTYNGISDVAVVRSVINTADPSMDSTDIFAYFLSLTAMDKYPNVAKQKQLGSVMADFITGIGNFRDPVSFVRGLDPEAAELLARKITAELPGMSQTTVKRAMASAAKGQGAQFQQIYFEYLRKESHFKAFFELFSETTQAVAEISRVVGTPDSFFATNELNSRVASTFSAVFAMPDTASMPAQTEFTQNVVEAVRAVGLPGSTALSSRKTGIHGVVKLLDYDENLGNQLAGRVAKHAKNKSNIEMAVDFVVADLDGMDTREFVAATHDFHEKAATQVLRLGNITSKQYTKSDLRDLKEALKRQKTDLKLATGSEVTDEMIEQWVDPNSPESILRLEFSGKKSFYRVDDLKLSRNLNVKVLYEGIVKQEVLDLGSGRATLMMGEAASTNPVLFVGKGAIQDKEGQLSIFEKVIIDRAKRIEAIKAEGKLTTTQIFELEKELNLAQQSFAKAINLRKLGTTEAIVDLEQELMHIGKNLTNITTKINLNLNLEGTSQLANYSWTDTVSFSTQSAELAQFASEKENVVKTATSARIEQTAVIEAVEQMLGTSIETDPTELLKGTGDLAGKSALNSIGILQNPIKPSLEVPTIDAKRVGELLGWGQAGQVQDGLALLKTNLTRKELKQLQSSILLNKGTTNNANQALRMLLKSIIK